MYKKINLSRRLQAIANEIKPNSVVADIGCDHALLSVFLAIYKKPKQVYACDINPKPLEGAKKNISEYKVEHLVKVVLSDGLDQLKVKESVDTVVIAGMGGELIGDIIKRAKWLKNKEITLLLQPMTGHETLRETLLKEGFCLKKEIPVVEKEKVYTVIKATFVGRIETHSPWYLYLGGIGNKTTKEAKAYKNWVIHRLEKQLEGLQKASNKLETSGLQQLLQDIRER